MTSTEIPPHAAQPPLKRIPRQYKERPFAVYDRHSGRLAATHTEGRILQGGTHARASQLLGWAFSLYIDGMRPSVIWLTGGTHAMDRPAPEWWREPLTAGYTITKWHTKPWRVTYAAHGISVDIAMMAPWFGAEHDARACYTAWFDLRHELRKRFDQHATLMSTPARTGMDLLERSLPLEKYPDNATIDGKRSRAVEYPAAPRELQELLRLHMGQGRMTCEAPPEVDTCAELFVYDGRWQYAACVSHLPLGPWEADDVPDLAPYRTGFYRVDVQIPRDWRHIGLIGIHSPNDGRRVWPNTPGQWVRGAWVSSAELDVAVNVAGWDVAIRERILAQPDSGTQYSNPGRCWIESLRDLRDKTENRLTAYATRHIVIDAVGYWWRPETRRHMVIPHGEPLPRDAGDVLLQPWGTECTVPAPVDPAQAAHYRPEWTATVWGRSLARTHKRALMVPHDLLGWIRSDSVVTLAPMTEWNDCGRVGDWRVKAWLEAPEGQEVMPFPRDEAAYRKLWQNTVPEMAEADEE